MPNVKNEKFILILLDITRILAETFKLSSKNLIFYPKLFPIRPNHQNPGSVVHYIGASDPYFKSTCLSLAKIDFSFFNRPIREDLFVIQ